MKYSFSLCFSLILFISSNTNTQEKHSPVQERFYGKWATGPEATKSFSIYTQNSTPSFGNYQLFIYCRNVYKRDTLLLYVIYTDTVTGCPDKWRPESDLFAKCYVTGTTMYVRYIDKAYRHNAREMDPPRRLFKQSDDLPQSWSQ